MKQIRRLERATKAGFVLLMSFGGLVSESGFAQNGPPPALVEVANANSELMAPQVYMPGTVISLNDSRVAAEIQGRITWVASEGVKLKTGDVIAEIDSRNLTLALERGKSQIKSLKARLDYQKSDFARIEKLAASRSTPTSRLEEARSNMLMTEEELAQAEIAMEQMLVDLERTKVRAPFPGRVVERLAQVGEYSTPGREIARLVDTEHLEVRAQAPVNLSSVLSDGQSVTLKQDQTVVDTAIRALVPVGDELSRTMEIRVSVPSDNPNNARYVVGTAVQVGLPARAPESVVSVPRDALVLRNEGTYVFRVKADNTAERLLVRTGAATGARVAITGGVESGDKVIVRGGERLRPGQSVRFDQSVETAEDVRSVTTSR